MSVEQASFAFVWLPCLLIVRGLDSQLILWYPFACLVVLHILLLEIDGLSCSWPSADYQRVGKAVSQRDSAAVLFALLMTIVSAGHRLR